MSIADRITSMSNNLSNAYDGIEYLGVDTTGVDKNLQNLSSMLNVVYEGLPKVSDEGVSPSITGSRVGRLKSTLKASDTTQESTTGKNKFSGFTFGIALNSSTGATFSSNVASTSDYIPVDFDTNSSYFLSGLTDTLHSNIWAYNSSKQGLGRTGNVVRTAIELTSTSFTNGTPQGTGDIAYIRVCQRIDGTDTGDPSKVNELATQLEPGNSATDYEPYTGGIPSPSPGYPQDIHVVKGNNTVEVCGKNLWSSEWEQGSISNSTGQNVTSSVTVRTKGYLSVIPGQHYTLIRSVYSGYINVRCYDKNKNYLGTGVDFINLIYGSTAGNPMQAGNMRCIISPKEDVYYLRFNDSSNDLSTQYMMTLGDNSDYNYEPYTGTTYPINLPQGLELCKIGDYQDYIYRENGNWYKHSDIGKVVLNGSETGWEAYTQTNTTNYYNNSLITFKAKSAICTHFAVVSSTAYDETTKLAVFSSLVGFGIYAKSDVFGSLSSFKTWLSTHNTTVYYPLATPTTTQITDTTLISQLNSLYNAMSYNEQTNILQTNADKPFIISASALKGE